MRQVQVELINAHIFGSGTAHPAAGDRYAFPNPLMLPYRTADGHYVALQMLAPDRNWPELCRVLGHPEVARDPRFADLAARRENSRPCIEWLEGITAPVQFDEQPARPVRAPELGEMTEEVLLELGLSWDELTALKDSHAIG